MNFQRLQCAPFTPNLTTAKREFGKVKLQKVSGFMDRRCSLVAMTDRLGTLAKPAASWSLDFKLIASI